ncbi:MAG: NUDIX pyrophosphatase [Longimonas sp.]|uniref:NUDIX hydrolase n=1 Tax=Longimonas sp. TaxID=2039626 RepID=UPI0033589319
MNGSELHAAHVEVCARVVDVYAYRMQSSAPEVLLLHRSQNVSYAGTWRMVGGKIETDETAWQAALRELDEETGLTPERFWAVPSLNRFYEWRHDRINLIPAFAARVSGAPALNNEHDTAAWWPIEEAARQLQWPEQQRLVRLIGQMLSAGIPASLVIPPEEW